MSDRFAVCPVSWWLTFGICNPKFQRCSLKLLLCSVGSAFQAQRALEWCTTAIHRIHWTHLEIASKQSEWMVIGFGVVSALWPFRRMSASDDCIWSFVLNMRHKHSMSDCSAEVQWIRLKQFAVRPSHEAIVVIGEPLLHDLLIVVMVIREPNESMMKIYFYVAWRNLSMNGKR